jgi:uncharacterized protein (UPF0335 family)
MLTSDFEPMFNELAKPIIEQLENLLKRVERLEADKRTLQQQVNRLTQAHHHQSQSMY